MTRYLCEARPTLTRSDKIPVLGQADGDKIPVSVQADVVTRSDEIPVLGQADGD